MTPSTQNPTSYKDSMRFWLDHHSLLFFWTSFKSPVKPRAFYIFRSLSTTARVGSFTVIITREGLFVLATSHRCGTNQGKVYPVPTDRMRSFQAGKICRSCRSCGASENPRRALGLRYIFNLEIRRTSSFLHGLCSVVVITPDFDSGNPGSNPGTTSLLLFELFFIVQCL